ncbi:serine/threonine-protein phosphatase [Streptomyces sp. OF3]|uniref:Serine/threonine-protein phosphatase n=1 Tax=Streptomyces alkaliterrae TaxID=2213162 RepID=A0A7W3ZN03_9ACTN|nr:PP2C family protein-serine/threonine phosphatase [Streptomyces alkaliterrae]MBB1254248.1 serine/threonine-protein phosphatase [Streptomyces alkaliterrae]
MRLLPAVLLGAAVVLNLVTPAHLTFLGLFVAAPLVAAAVDTPRVTLATVVATLVITTPLLTVVNEPPGLVPVERTVLVGTVLVVAVLALVVNAILVAARRRMMSALGVAEVVQRAVVPSPPRRSGPLSVAARYRPAHRDNLIGGDLYATQETPFGTRLIVGDVSGKGLGAAAAVAVVLGAFREWSTHEPELASLACRLEEALLRENRRTGLLSPEEGFVTAVLVEIPRAFPDRLSAVCCGHPPPLLLPPGEPPYHLPVAESAPPLGLGLDREALRNDVRDARFPPGCFLLLYTDGVTESRDVHGEFYDPATALGGRTFRDADELADALVAGVVAHTHGALKDDAALLAVHHLPVAPRVEGR